MIVMKFGGSSVGSAERIKATNDIILKFKERKPVVVVSAVGGVTDMLLNAADKALDEGTSGIKEIEDRHNDIIESLGLEKGLLDSLFKELKEIIEVVAKIKDDSAKTTDIICSFGERMSSRIVAAYLNKTGTKSVNHDAYDIGFVTDNNFGSAEILSETYNNVKRSLSDYSAIPIVTGFIAKTKKGQITTLGRGGSDYTAAIIAAAIDAEEIQIWTDVDGVMTSDPRLVKDAKSLKEISFAEAAESAYFGAKVLHPKTIVPAVSNNIPVKVLNSFNPDHEGTTIVKEHNVCEGTVKIISLKKDVTVFNINSTRMLDAYGFLAKVFEIFSKYRMSVDMLATSEVSLSLTIDQKNCKDKIEKITEELRAIGEVNVETGKSIVCLVGCGMKTTIGVTARIFNTLAKKNVRVDMVSRGASEINLGFVVNRNDAENAVIYLHKEFFG